MRPRDGPGHGLRLPNAPTLCVHDEHFHGGVTLELEAQRFDVRKGFGAATTMFCCATLHGNGCTEVAPGSGTPSSNTMARSFSAASKASFVRRA